MNKFPRKKTGFTMVEIMAIIAIMGIMLLVGMASLNSTSSNEKIKSAQREVASAVRTAKSYALQGKTVGSPPQAPKYWGFKIENDSTYKIISASVFGTDSSQETYTLSSGVKFIVPSSPNDKVYFDIPNGSLFNGTGGSYAGDNTITLNLGSVTKTVVIKLGGLVTEP
jgi:Tfp pilus assembly protein FimT